MARPRRENNGDKTSTKMDNDEMKIRRYEYYTKTKYDFEFPYFILQTTDIQATSSLLLSWMVHRKG